MTDSVFVEPKQMPSLRADLATKIPKWFTKSPNNTDAETMSSVVRHVESAELFFLKPEFDELMCQAAIGLPSHRITSDDPPVQSGIALRSSASVRPRPDKPRWFRSDSIGYLWVCLADKLVVAELSMWRGDPQASVTLPKLFPLTASFAYGSTVESLRSVAGEGRVATWSDVQDIWVRELVSFWNLIRQDSLAMAVKAPFLSPTASRTKGKKGRRFKTPEVRLIHLRPSASAGCSSPTNREWRHRWIVRGHWRKQWYSKLQDHRPVWIAPHIKGPEDKPLLGGHKVYVADADTVAEGGAAS